MASTYAMASGQSAWPNKVGAVMAKKQQDASLSELSKCLEGLADFLSDLPYWATCDDPKHAPSFVEQCCRWASDCYFPIIGRGDVFAGFVPPADFIEFPRQSYKSAHVAAVSEVVYFFDQLWFCIDRESDGTATKVYQNLRTENVQQLIRENWELTKKVILDKLDPDWQEVFKTVPSRIASERAQYESKYNSQSGTTSDIWYSVDEGERPKDVFDCGPLDGTLKELSRWMGEEGGQGRRVKLMSEVGVVWVLKFHGRHWEVWFKTQDTYALANRRRIDEKKKPTIIVDSP